MYAFLINNLETGFIGITVYKDLDSAVEAFENHYGTEDDDKFVLKFTPEKPFGLNFNGSFGGEEIVSSFYH
jgi:hypothetical protein